MPKSVRPRILVADDDLGVIAAYRYVLESSDAALRSDGRTTEEILEAELFGKSEEAAIPPGERWRVTFVDQGDDAVAAVGASLKDSDPYSVVFLDIRMPPGLDGYETAKQIRQLDRVVHIVFVSGFSDYTEQALIEVAGPSHRVSFLPKPVWPLQLKSKALAVCRDARLVSLCRTALGNRICKQDPAVQ